MAKIFCSILMVFHCLLAGAQVPQSYATDTLSDQYGFYKVITLRDSIIMHKVVHDTIYLSALEDIPPNLRMTFDEFVKHFLNYAAKPDSLSESFYINYFKGLIHDEFKKYRYILREYQIGPAVTASGVKVNRAILRKSQPLPNQNPDSLNLDFLFVLKGDKNTSLFLNSPKQQVRALHQVLSDVYEYKKQHDHQIGINFYFPDFDFREKRAMAQFIKSASLIVDSIRLPQLRNLPLYFTFDHAEEHLHYLTGMSFMADQIFLIRQHRESDITPFLPFDPLDRDKINVPFFEQLKNQVYLARYYIQDFPITSSDALLIDDIEQLAAADYPEGIWEYYMFSIFILTLMGVTGICCYLFIPAFANFVNENSTYIYAGTIILFLEIYLLFVFMVEGASADIIFSLQNNHTLLFLPLMIMFVIPLFRQIVGQRESP